MTPDGIVEARRLCAAATKGPWRACPGGCPCGQVWAVADDLPVAETRIWWRENRVAPAVNSANASFIAAAREFLPAALDEIEAQKVLIRALSEQLKAFGAGPEADQCRRA